jgi:hypothetical protein
MGGDRRARLDRRLKGEVDAACAAVKAKTRASEILARCEEFFEEPIARGAVDLDGDAGGVPGAIGALKGISDGDEVEIGKPTAFEGFRSAS